MSISFTRLIIVLGLALPVALPLSGCRSAKSNSRYYPQESLLKIIGGFDAHDQADLYRFAPPKDLSGQNVFKATLVRLDNYQALYPETNRDMIDLARAGAYERLGEYGEAYRFYRRAAVALEEHESPLLHAPAILLARRSMKALDEFLALEQLRPQAQTFGELIDEYEARATAWRQLTTSSSLRSQPYLSLALIELEEAELLVADTIWQYRGVLENGPPRAIERLAQLIENHAASRRVDDHMLKLGRWWEQRARDYVTQNPPSRFSFQPEQFADYLNQAREQYRKVAGAYGSPWRTEAVAAQETLEEFAKRIVDEYG